MKKCSKCKEDKNLELFGKLRTSKDGLRYECNECRKAYRASHIEEIRAYNFKNKDKIKIRKNTKDAKNRQKESNRRHRLKYPNSHKSRDFYGKNKHKIIIPDNCQVCGIKKKDLEGHHRDYNLPMDVIFLCVPCHVEEHKINTPLNRVSGIFTNKLQEQ